ncbi:MAG: CinA family protein [Candidatus Chisholmbacteria bacterium]|nr:CinA family protein [Candidatus Chisholmbacteria bacterium]
MAETLLIPQEPTLLNQLTEQLSDEMATMGLTIATAEGCTGGDLANTLTIPGATRVFHVGSIPYSRQAKIELGVLPQTIDRFGEYAPEVAVEMAQLIQRFRDDWVGVGITGMYESTGSVANLALVTREGRTKIKTIDLPPTPRYIQKQLTTLAALSEVYQLLPHRVASNIPWHVENIRWATGSLGSSVMDELYRDELIVSTVQKLQRNKLKIAIMESCTGGLLIDALTSVPGASEVVEGGEVAYDEDVKAKFKVSLLSMVNGMVYSLRTARAMAEAKLHRSPMAHLAIGITGVMENRDTRPFHEDFEPGTIFVAIARRDGTRRELGFRIPVASRETIKVAIVRKILAILNSIVEEVTPVREATHHLVS